MGGLDTFFKQYEIDWFWPLIEALGLHLEQEYPDRPEPVALSPEAVESPKAPRQADVLFRLGEGPDSVHLLVENTSYHNDEIAPRMVEYILHFYRSGYRRLLALLLYVTPESAPADLPAVSEVEHTSGEAGGLAPAVAIRYRRVVLHKVLPPIDNAPPELLPLYMVQQPRWTSAKHLAKLEALITTTVVPKLQRIPDRAFQEQVVGYIIAALGARHETLMRHAWEAIMRTMQYEGDKQHPIFRLGREEGREESLRETVVRIGTQRFGAPTAATREALAAIAGIERLERMIDRLLVADGWDDLLATPADESDRG